MGYDLRNGNSKDFRFSDREFGPMLQLAEQHGWKPHGTLLPSLYDIDTGEEIPSYEDDWSGFYLSNDGQIVTDEDAAALADALERALASSSELDLSQDRDLIQRFIEYCRDGYFFIT